MGTPHTRLVVPRGNSASGKSSVAAADTVGRVLRDTGLAGLSAVEGGGR